MMDDVTRRLRTNPNPESVDRERYMAANLFGDALRETEGRLLSEEAISRMARQSIVAACVFWESWEIACLTYNPATEPDTVYGFCIDEMR